METSEKSNGIGLFGVLQLIFITLKLCNLIAWSWWVVFWPCYVSLFLAFITLVIIVLDDE